MTYLTDPVSVSLAPLLSSFYPAGPLSHLLMDRNGRSRLGLYVDKKNDQLVLIGKYAGQIFIFNPTYDQLDGMMKNKLTIHKLLNACFISMASRDPPDIFNWLWLKWWIIRGMKGFLNQQKKYVLYPNYYYVFSDWLLANQRQ